jgi:SAM-dependent methyltransferase
MQEKRHTDWFATWFNSPYYHTLYKHRNCNEAESFISKLVDFLKPPAHARFLDLACGKGRHSVFLNKKGFDVTGLDLAPESIKEASLHENATLHFYVHDMRRLFRTNYFDYIVNLFTSFGYFENERDEQATIQAVAKGLKPEGIFVLDFFNSEKVIRNMKAQDELRVEGIRFRIRKTYAEGYIVKQIEFSDKGKDFHFKEKVRALTLPDFERYFSASGLKILHLWGDYELGAFDVNSSDRLIILAQKEHTV